MRLSAKLILATAFALALLPGSAFCADDKERVLRQLDAAAAKFHNTTADFLSISYQTDPVPDQDKQEGTVYYDRSGNGVRMAGHIRTVNGKPITKIYTFNKGVLQLYEKAINQITILRAGGSAEGYLVLGFGASGKDLEAKWDIRYLGSEMLKDGNTAVKTEKLELVAKDPAVRKNIARVVIWVDPDRAISLKQTFYENSSEYRDCFYFNVKLNNRQDDSVYTIKPDGKPNVVTR